ncbi:alpha/beta hydrolase [Parahaliea aestuarii]|uniref:Alpha/beta hydrolase n=1 Tax=Parahaliea aestuarii TaxID=1852021 RepID=A0A5C8ZS60_9GAMM|nr:alpha/beta hydrolase [Parahaliea aestuarii]TXS90569.1 alpha/beta hydrolase [Parahaliea aestuarii]
MSSRRTFPFVVRNSSPTGTPRQLLKSVFVTLPLIFIAACEHIPGPQQLAQHYQLEAAWQTGGDFSLLSLARPGALHSRRLHIYLAGDGQPWHGSRPARNPTGRRSMALELLQQDPSPALYLARPCYHLDTMPARCTAKLWTSGRYSPEVVASMSDALTTLLENHSNIEEVLLIGYSGGGNLALLLAPRLPATVAVAVLTVAANLDTDAWTGHHRVLSLSDSLNPAVAITTTASEMHLQGSEDTIVPPTTTRLYFQRHPGAKAIQLPDFDHRCCWVEQWPRLLALAPPAQR